jgi:hypothetical protein
VTTYALVVGLAMEMKPLGPAYPELLPVPLLYGYPGIGVLTGRGTTVAVLMITTGPALVEAPGWTFLIGDEASEVSPAAPEAAAGAAVWVW